MDTDINHKIVTETDPASARSSSPTPGSKRNRMKQVCSHCHTGDYVNAFYKQYDDLVILYNEKFAKPGKAIMDAPWRTRPDHHADPVRRRDRVDLVLPLAPRRPPRPSRRVDDGARLRALARHVRGRRALLHGADPAGARDRRARAGATARRPAPKVEQVIDDILARPEHAWFEGAEEAMRKIREA